MINLNEYPKTKVIISAPIGITGFVIIPQSARIITAIKYTKFRPIIDSKPLNTLVFKIIPKTKIERIKNENKSSAKTSKPSFCKKSPKFRKTTITIKKRKKSAQKTTVREIYIKSEYNDMSENSGMFFRKKKNGKRRVAKRNARGVFC